MSFYSPFVDEKGNMTAIEDVQFSQIAQLKERGIEEGYKVEYKQFWNNDVKERHLCKTIVSFANSEGGWLFVGIDNDGSYVGILEEKADFSQTIAQLLLEKASPVPVFACRYIKETDDSNKGVLVIYVYEGVNPPYVVDGTVYLRNGSSKDPQKPGRPEIDHLISKRDKFLSQLKNLSEERLLPLGLPSCTISFFNQYAHTEKVSGLGKIKKLESLNKTLKNRNESYRVCSCGDAVLCYNSPLYSVNSVSLIEEYFITGHIKLHIPLVVVEKETQALWERRVKGYNRRIDLCGTQCIDTYLSTNLIIGAVKDAIDYISSLGIPSSNYLVSACYSQMKNVALYFRTPPNEDGAAIENVLKECYSSGLPLSCPTDTYNEPYCSIDEILMTEEKPELRALGTGYIFMLSTFPYLFGLDKESFNKLWANSILLYPDKSYSSIVNIEKSRNGS